MQTQSETRPDGRSSLKRRYSLRRAKTPTLLQMEAVECGAAALGIILAYYGKYVSLEELRVACGVSRDGSKASNVLRAARSYGLEAKGYKFETDTLREQRFPVIVFWQFRHFLVVEGFHKDRVYLNDPATGPRTISREDFDRAFTGVVLSFSPGPEFQRSGNPPSLLNSLRTRLHHAETALLQVILLSIALVIPGLLLPAFGRMFVDEYLVKGMDTWVQPLLIGMGITAALRGLFTWLQQYLLLRFETHLSLSASSKFFWHALRLPMDFYLQRFAGEVGSRVAINDRIAQLLSGELATVVLSMLTMAFYVLVLFLYDTVVAVVSLLFVCFNGLALRWVSRRRKDAHQRLQQEGEKVLATSMAGLQVIESLKASGQESDFFQRWSGHHASLVNAQQELAVPTQLLAAVPSTLNALSTAAVLTVGGFRIMEGQLTIGMLVAIQSLVASFAEPINRLVQLGGQLQEAEGNLRRLDDVLRHATDPAVPADPVLPPPTETVKLAGYLELRNVTFGYSRLAPPLIRDFQLALRPGSRVAIVGGSGSGKSTVARLVAGLYQPWDGDVLLDGLPRQQWNRQILAHSLTVVDQEIFLFEGSVRDNLTLWDPTIPESEVVQAAKDACIHDTISALPRGYESQVAESGRNFSGGQRQRLEIARALVNNPAIIVMDEATSALDPITEK